MGIESQILSALVGLKQASNQAAIANQQAVVAKKTAKNQQLTEGFNSAQRQRDRINRFRARAAENRARGGASGIDAFSGSADNVNRFSAGNLKTANFEDVFSTKNKRAAITEAGANKALGYQNQARAAKTRGLSTLLNTGSDIYDKTDGFTKFK